MAIAKNINLVDSTSTYDSYLVSEDGKLRKVEKTNTINEILDLVYPVGSIYMSVNSVNPSTIFGGTWERWGEGRVPVGVYEPDSDFSEAGLIGGEKTHKLTTGEMPSHKHSLNNDGGNIGYYDGSNGSYRYSTGWNPQSTRTDISISSGSTGGSQAHNNLQPYITCYMWKRTA